MTILGVKMGFFGFYWLYYILGIIMIPGIALGIWAQMKVYSTFNEYNKIDTKHDKSAKDVARFLLDAGGCYETKITHINGELTDNYNPKTNTISLSDAVYNQHSIAAIGVTAHEIGHVFQHREKYGPIKLRNFLVPVVNVLGYFAWPLILIGLILETSYLVFAADILIYIGVGVYGLSTLFTLITLPIELNASKRAQKMLLATGELDTEEVEGVKKVLNAAAWTYVAALITSILSLLRLLLFIFSMRGRR